MCDCVREGFAVLLFVRIRVILDEVSKYEVFTIMMKIDVDLLVHLRKAIREADSPEIALVLRKVREAYPSLAECEDEELQKKLLFVLGKHLQSL